MTRGFVFAATGEGYITLARRSARALRRLYPDAQVDLFTDQDPGDDVFDQVHPLKTASRRPKIEAMVQSRFDQTLYLDADTIVVAPLDDAFDVLEHFDLALCAEQRRNDLRNRTQLDGHPVPPSFPAYNSGVMAVRRSDQTQAFLQNWHDWVHTRDQRFDQPSLRWLLWSDPDIRHHTLPPEFNVMFLAPFVRGSIKTSAPRLLHLPKLHQAASHDPAAPLDASDALSSEQCENLMELLRNDHIIDRFVDIQTAKVAAPVPNMRKEWIGKFREWTRKRI